MKREFEFYVRLEADGKFTADLSTNTELDHHEMFELFFLVSNHLTEFVKATRDVKMKFGDAPEV